MTAKRQSAHFTAMGSVNGHTYRCVTDAGYQFVAKAVPSQNNTYQEIYTDYFDRPCISVNNLPYVLAFDTAPSKKGKSLETTIRDLSPVALTDGDVFDIKQRYANRGNLKEVVDEFLKDHPAMQKVSERRKDSKEEVYYQQYDYICVRHESVSNVIKEGFTYDGIPLTMQHTMAIIDAIFQLPYSKSLPSLLTALGFVYTPKTIRVDNRLDLQEREIEMRGESYAYVKYCDCRNPETANFQIVIDDLVLNNLRNYKLPLHTRRILAEHYKEFMSRKQGA